ncbi:hypothetical protein LguiA_014366 [Lonicera macranthoides]
MSEKELKNELKSVVNSAWRTGMQNTQYRSARVNFPKNLVPDRGAPEFQLRREFEELRVVWNVVLVGFGGVFSMMNCKGKGRVGLGGGGWFSEELPSSACCFSGGKSGLSSDLRVRLGEVGGGKVLVEKVSVVSWRQKEIFKKSRVPS